MSKIKPFKAVRPYNEFAARVASPPYDVLSSEEARAVCRQNPYSFLHITKSEVDLPENTDVHTPEVYHKAKENLNSFLSKGILFQDDAPCYYIYQLIMNGRKQTGLCCVSSVDDYEKGLIKKHEFTRPEKEKDRIDHIIATRAQTGNVFLAYRTNENIDSIINHFIETEQPVYDFTAEDGITHRIWAINNPATIDSITTVFSEEIPATYIADGHHRAASAAKSRSALSEIDSVEAGYFLTTLFPSDQLEIMDYNRVIKSLNRLTPENFLKKLEEDFYIEKKGDIAVKPEKLHEFGLYLENSWYRLEAKEGTFSEDPIGVLDVTILQNNILGKHLAIHDQRTDKNIDFVGGIRGLKELERRVNSGEMKMAFSLFPVSIEQLFSIADTGQVMPPKSTWFEPKLRDGLLTHIIRS